MQWERGETNRVRVGPAEEEDVGSRSSEPSAFQRLRRLQKLRGSDRKSINSDSDAFATGGGPAGWGTSTLSDERSRYNAYNIGW
ncbi:hypothetical protein SLEP1_g44688 [Rubroshorea leprosula]|uniref:Uncharacterized protein n=1 Tax=Rubroshorea leprosula TaxID=152421 RepID=A0AAV5LGW8_9ROSI|nr:hypothetical protein SLEP1_g44688 [Rubroshorea leprosula]